MLQQSLVTKAHNTNSTPERFQLSIVKECHICANAVESHNLCDLIFLLAVKCLCCTINNGACAQGA